MPVYVTQTMKRITRVIGVDYYDSARLRRTDLFNTNLYMRTQRIDFLRTKIGTMEHKIQAKVFDDDDDRNRRGVCLGTAGFTLPGRGRSRFPGG